MSGGQRQRISLARGLVLELELLIADEPTSALDVSVQAVVLELFQRLQRELGFAALFISHDLAVIDMVSHRVGVLYRGDLVETGWGYEVMSTPERITRKNSWPHYPSRIRLNSVNAVCAVVDTKR